jgi:hypothetical protein
MEAGVVSSQVDAHGGQSARGADTPNQMSAPRRHDVTGARPDSKLETSGLDAPIAPEKGIQPA